MDPADLLRDEREAALARRRDLDAVLAGVVAASEGSNADDEHDPEGSTIAFERAQVQALLDQATRQVAAIDAALTRIADGTYGACLVCGQPIAGDRLAARPAARTCIGCASGRPA